MPTGDPVKGKNGVESGKLDTHRTKSDDTADIRDIVSAIVGGGHKDLSDENIRNEYTYLSYLVGNEKAQKIFNYALIFNQTPSVQNKSPQERITQFYSINPRDKELETLFTGLKSFGYGPQEGIQSSPFIDNMKLTGRYKEEKKGIKDIQVSEIKDMIDKSTAGTTK